jgi:dolichol-phosphate mannosyltransferase
VNTPDFSVVVPLYNEADSVAILQEEISLALQGRNYELILVDDGSTDGTIEHIQKHPNLRVLQFKKNAGQSAALLAGMRAAGGETIVLLDGDLQNDPRDIPRLLAEVERGADLVCGYRVFRKDRVSKRISSRIANAVRSRFVGDGVRDTGCTLKAMRRACVKALVPFKGVHRFIPAFVKSAGFKIVEIPVNHRPRRYGVSKYGLGSRVIRATLDMFGVRWLQSRRVDLAFVEFEHPEASAGTLRSRR